MNEPLFIVCHNGVFLLPDAVYESLAALARNAFVYIREDEDALLISTTPVNGGRKRVLHTRVRSPMFLDEKYLAIVDLKESIRVMPVT